MEPISKKSEVIDNYYDDKTKLLANSLTGGVYDLGQMFWEGNPASYVANWWTGEDVDLPGLGEWATGWTPFEDGGGTFFDYDEGFKPFGFEPESVENVGRGLSSFLVPVAGLATAPKKAKAVYDVMGKVFPSLKHWDDVGIMNQKIRAAINAEKGVKSNWPKITGVWDRFIRPMYQMPTRMVKHAVTPTRWKQGWDKTIDPKGLGRIDPKTLRTAQPERTYSSALGRNWALGTGAKLGIDTLQNKALASLSSYEDPIMRMARKRDPGLEVTLPLQYTQ